MKAYFTYLKHIRAFFVYLKLQGRRIVSLQTSKGKDEMTSKQQGMLRLGIYPGYSYHAKSAKLTSYNTSSQEI